MPLPGLEPGFPASEADALSSELQGLAGTDFAIGETRSQVKIASRRLREIYWQSFISASTSFRITVCPISA